MYASRKIKSGSQRTSFRFAFKLPLDIFDLDVIYEQSQRDGRKKPTTMERQRDEEKRGMGEFLVYITSRVRNSAIFDHWILVKLRKTTISQLSSYRIRSLARTSIFDSLGLWICLVGEMTWLHFIPCVSIFISQIQKIAARSDLLCVQQRESSWARLNSGTNKAPHLLFEMTIATAAALVATNNFTN